MLERPLSHYWTSPLTDQQENCRQNYIESEIQFKDLFTLLTFTINVFEEFVCKMFSDNANFENVV